MLLMYSDFKKNVLRIKREAIKYYNKLNLGLDRDDIINYITTELTSIYQDDWDSLRKSVVKATKE